MSRHEPQLAADEEHDQGVERFLARCRAGPSEALAALMEQLAWAGVEHERASNARVGVRIAMAALCVFCKERGSGQAALMFAQLGDSFGDLDWGTESDLLRARRAEGVGNRPPDRSEKRRAIVYGLECVERLRSMEHLTVTEARGIVAGWLTGRPEFDEPCTAMKLRNWQQRVGREAQFEEMRRGAKAAFAVATTRDDLRLRLDQLGKPPC